MIENRTTEQNAKDTSDTGKSCAIGSCGGPGVCPGIALLLAYAVGGGLIYLTGLTWLGWLVGVPLAIILITGAWARFPLKRKPGE